MQFLVGFLSFLQVACAWWAAAVAAAVFVQSVYASAGIELAHQAGRVTK